MPFGLKNAGATFQRAMSYALHDIKHIFEAYLDYLVAGSKKRVNHPAHLRAVFMQCRYYNIRLNPPCIFCLISRRLVGFLMSKYGIMADLIID